MDFAPWKMGSRSSRSTWPVVTVRTATQTASAAIAVPVTAQRGTFAAGDVGCLIGCGGTDRTSRVGIVVSFVSVEAGMSKSLAEIGELAVRRALLSGRRLRRHLPRCR